MKRRLQKPHMLPLVFSTPSLIANTCICLLRFVRRSAFMYFVAESVVSVVLTEVCELMLFTVNRETVNHVLM